MLEAWIITVRLHPILTLQASITRKRNTAHHTHPPAPPSSCSILPLTSHRLPSPSGRNCFYFAHGKRNPRLVGWLEIWQGWFHILSESPSCRASIRCNVNPDQCLFLFIKSLELTAEKIKRAGHYPLHVTHSLADGLVFISLPCL